MNTYKPINDLAIKNLHEDDRPREKLLKKGRHTLSDAELIAILIGSGTRNLSAIDVSKLLLNTAQNNLHQLAKMSLKEMQKIEGIGEAKAITIMSALEIGRRRKEADPLKKEVIKSSKDVYTALFAELSDLPHEEFWVLLLDRANQIVKKVQVSSGGVAGTVADPKLLFKQALEHSASSIILIHNHPSGNTKPSQADISLTKKAKEGGKFLDIPVLDHIIFTNDSYFSFADEGIL